ncbi:MAG: IS110 family transposase [Candidatus Eremiobacteraeota bacterium]|nr:IS110 family transposase [Candidatus Eremiobacteraeota bacterium]MBC5805014.1 IS110 family transposase [Candidatus Eremiobacteraeota bacterium]
MPFVAGVDCHKDSHSIVFLDGTGKVVRELTISTTEAGFESAVSAAREIGDVTWGLEGTGSYGRSFARVLLDAGMAVFEVPGVLTKRHRKSASHHGKSDRNDARAIAEAVLRESGRLPQYRELEEQEALRLRYDQRDRLVRERTMSINRLRHGALRLALKVSNQLRSESSLAALGAAFDAIEKPGMVEQALIDEMRFNLGTVARLDGQIARLEKIMAPFVLRLAPEILELQGVSTIVAAGLIGHAGDLRNLRDSDAFAMRSATAPVSWSSGRSEAVRLNTGGNRQLNRLLHIIALIQVRTPGHLGRAHYERKRSEGKSTRAAMRSLKRRLATVVYYRLRTCQARIEAQSVLLAA